MFRGELATSPIPVLLQELAARSATGDLRILADDDTEAIVRFRAGEVHAVATPGPKPGLGARLVTCGALAPEALAAALATVDSQFEGWPLERVLVDLGYVTPPAVAAFAAEQVREGCSELLAWETGTWGFAPTEGPATDVACTLPVPQLLQEMLDRQRAWTRLTEFVSGPAAVPELSATGLAGGQPDLSADDWAVLSLVDAERSVRQLAEICGFTPYEVTYAVARLIHSGLLTMTEAAIEEPAAAEQPWMAAVAGLVEDDASLNASALLSELSHHEPAAVGPVPDTVPIKTEQPPPDSQPEVPAAHDNDTAALMRELSFLGVEGPPANAPAAPPGHTARPRTPTARKKRKGVFGR